MAKELPPEFDVTLYRENNRDLDRISDDGLAEHYQKSGVVEGRVASVISSRVAFLNLLPDTSTVLEIGPFCSPSAKGTNVRYFDVFDTEELRRRAKDYGLDPDLCPHIDYVSSKNTLAGIPERFSAALSSHCIEHQPDLVRHLNEVSDILDAKGRYFVVIPDHRYCFDHFRSPSTIADVLGAHLQRRVFHDPRSILEYRLLRTHNDSNRHWAGEHGRRIIEENPEELVPSIEEASHFREYYIDTHAWYLTPASLREIIGHVRRAGLCNLEVSRIYPTVRPSNEFYAVLSRQ